MMIMKFCKTVTVKKSAKIVLKIRSKDALRHSFVYEIW
jgi:hypothetical protein